MEGRFPSARVAAPHSGGWETAAPLRELVDFDEGGTGGGGPDGESGTRRMKSRDEEASRRGDRYTRMTASRRASRCTGRYISRRMTESNGVYRTGLRHFRL